MAVYLAYFIYSEAKYFFENEKLNTQQLSLKWVDRLDS